MISIDRRRTREDLDRFIGRLPRRVAYPLILAFSIVLWSAAAVAAIKIAQAIAALMS